MLVATMCFDLRERRENGDLKSVMTSNLWKSTEAIIRRSVVKSHPCSSPGLVLQHGDHLELQRLNINIRHITPTKHILTACINVAWESLTNHSKRPKNTSALDSNTESSIIPSPYPTLPCMHSEAAGLVRMQPST